MVPTHIWAGEEAGVSGYVELIRSRFISLYSAEDVPSDFGPLKDAVTLLDDRVAELVAGQIVDERSAGYGSWGFITGERADVMNRDHGPGAYDRGRGVNHADIWLGGAYYGKPFKMAQAYVCRASRFHDDPDLLKRIEAALAFGERFIRPGEERPGNWWAWDIGIPQNVSGTLLLVGERISPQLRQALVRALYDLGNNYFKHGWKEQALVSGINGIWVARCAFRTGLVEGDAGLLRFAADAIARRARYAAGEGLQPSGVYHYHGPTPSMHYGGVHLVAVSRQVFLTRGTPYAVPADSIRDHITFLERFAIWNTYRGKVMPLSIGRSVAKAYADEADSEANYDASADAAALFLLASDIPECIVPASSTLADSARRVDKRPLDVVEATLRYRTRDALAPDARPVTGVRYYPTSDYFIARGDDFAAAVRLNSKRTIGWRSAGGNHLKGWYVALGSVTVMTDGSEWGPAAAVTWPWTALTGTTRALDLKPQRNRWGEGEFCAGAALDGAGIGCAGMGLVLTDDEQRRLTAEKAYFAFGNLLVLAGSNINVTGCREPARTVLLTLPIEAGRQYCVTDGGELGLADGEAPRHSPGYLHYRNVGIIWPEQDLLVRTETRSGTWDEVRLHLVRDPARYTARYLSIFAEHGVNPTGAAYEATLALGVSAAETAELAAAPRVVRARGDASVVAYRTADGSAGQAVFFAAGSSAVGDMDRPGALAWQVRDGSLELAVYSAHEGPVRVSVPFGPCAVAEAEPAGRGVLVIGSDSTRTVLEYVSDGQLMARGTFKKARFH